MDLLVSLRFTLAHHEWAIARLLDECERLTAEQFDRDLGIGPGSLRINIAHTLEAMLFFADNFATREFVEPAGLASLGTTVTGLRTLLARASVSLRDSMMGAVEAGLGPRVHWPNAPGGSMSVAAAIAQVFDHAIAHRAQCVNMLKRLGVPPPDLDPMTFEASRHRD